MNVKELIDYLQMLPSDMDVVIAKPVQGDCENCYEADEKSFAAILEYNQLVIFT